MCAQRMLIAVSTVLVLAACGERASTDTRSGASTTTSSAPRYEVDATVLQDTRHGPQLCAGTIMDSLPPQYGGAEIPGWNWAAVDGEQSQHGTTWGEFHLVGTYDGTTFRLTQSATGVQREATTPPALADPHTPCPAPLGGWSIVDPSRVTLDDYNALQNAARVQSDFSGVWVDEATGRPGIPGDLTHDVLNFAFTQDLDRHRRELAALWGGPICVVQRARTEVELVHVRDALMGEFGRSIGLQAQSGGITGVDGPHGLEFVVDVSAMVVTDEMRQAIDEEFGPGLVKLDARLHPVG